MNRRQFIQTGLLIGFSKTIPQTNHIVCATDYSSKLLIRLNSVQSIYDLVDVARSKAKIAPDSIWVRLLFRTAIMLATGAQEHEYAGEAINRSLHDFEWGREVMLVAIEKSDCAEDLASIAYTLAKHDGFSDFDWATEVFTMAVGKAQSIAELIDVAYTMCWADGFLPHTKMMFLEMTNKVCLPDHLIGIPEKLSKYDFESARWAGKAMREHSPESILQDPPLSRDKILSFLLKANLV